MHSHVTRDAAYLHGLQAFLHNEYGLHSIHVAPAPRGYYGETWKVESQEGTYFVKVVYAKAHQERYAHSFTALEHIHQCGVPHTSTIVKTLSGALYAYFDSAVCGVFAWVEGNNVQNRNTKIAEYHILASVYAVPTEGLAIPRDSLDTNHADTFYRWLTWLEHHHDDATARQLWATFAQHRRELDERAERLALFAKRINMKELPFYITHGDAGGNIITQGDSFTLVDWDSVRLAPPERDAWFCLHWNWAIDAFNEALHSCGLAYTLQPNLLAYYCYDSYFYYLVEYMATFCELKNADMPETIEGFFHGWIAEELAFADKMP